MSGHLCWELAAVALLACFFANLLGVFVALLIGAPEAAARFLIGLGAAGLLLIAMTMFEAHE